MNVRLHVGRRMATNGFSLLLAVSASGCTSWHTQQQELHLLFQTPPARVRLNVEGEGYVVLRHPELSTDSVVGIEQGVDSQGGANKRRAFAVSQIESVQTRIVSGSRTTLFMLLVGATAYVVVARPGHD